MNKFPHATELIEGMVGAPVPEVLSRIADELEKNLEGGSVPIALHLQAMATATLQGLAFLARDLGAALKALGMDGLDPDEYADTVRNLTMLRAQVEVYERMLFPGEPLEVVEALPDEPAEA